MKYAALFPCNRLEPASELFGYAIQLIDPMEKFNCCARSGDGKIKQDSAEGMLGG
ncbi:hypothetical protein NLM33_05190 [Bradyrhizobium sp. CCGUVB1N3]|uniref:hypothetical protein n=1 Tax=Bradyrhizobium sp. CCGUVB1N3 TaxID=2949629 RepID=UPI0020B3D1AD|nr:hypothetical protein [Bradyrhizobium sp. CCGUVB1N3]MCP3469723.1 hypothetical protein [Bradyrhizobium sp. CCGUVB1N3]